MTDPTCSAFLIPRGGDGPARLRCHHPPAHEAGAYLPLCDGHYKRALEWAREIARSEDPSVVYYVRRSDGLIKIGTSRSVAARLAALAREHGPLVLMAVHGGGRAEEAVVHRALKALRVEGEWFRPGLPLLEHIVRARKTMGNLEREDDGLPPRMNRIELGKMVAQVRREAAA